MIWRSVLSRKMRLRLTLRARVHGAASVTSMTMPSGYCATSLASSTTPCTTLYIGDDNVAIRSVALLPKMSAGSTGGAGVFARSESL